ncbi:MAG TPA: S53 family peptidase [Myxococcaceae bacterium]|nr:S53 family peptidase [Myxococcaceae bacterium]
MATRIDRPSVTPPASPRPAAPDRVPLKGSAVPDLASYEKVSPSANLARGSSPKRTVSMVLNSGADLGAVKRFATSNGLDVASVDRGTGTVKLSGTNDQLGKAFGVQVSQYRGTGSSAKQSFLAYEGDLQLPRSLSGKVQSVLGMSTKPVAHTMNTGLNTAVSLNPSAAATPAAVPTRGYTGADVAKAYDFPTATGKGQKLAIIELGGGYKQADLDTYFKKIGVPEPKVTAVSVDGAKNAPDGDPNGADGEVDLDIDVAGAVAPGADIKVYFAPNTDQGFVDAINQAVKDQGNTPGAISISWGGSESDWSPTAQASMDAAIKNAAAKGVNVYVASGDDGSSDGKTDGKNHSDFPASSPFAIATGGTRLQTGSNGQRGTETAWGGIRGNGASGGGFSTTEPVPDFQKGVVPAGTTHRGVPDIAGNADPQTPYFVQVDGTTGGIGGTSAVAPLMAALNARLGEALKGPVPNLNKVAYANPSAFFDVTQGTNGAFKAGKGWDPVTGLGVPDGNKLLDAMKKMKQR